RRIDASSNSDSAGWAPAVDTAAVGGTACPPAATAAGLGDVLIGARVSAMPLSNAARILPTVRLQPLRTMSPASAGPQTSIAMIAAAAASDRALRHAKSLPPS